MKKTLIALFALASCAMGVTETFDAATKSATIALTLDVNALKGIAGENFAGNASTKPNIFMFEGTWTNISGTPAGQIGVANNGATGNQNITSDNNSGMWGSWVKGNDSSQSLSLGDDLKVIFNANTDWNSISALSLVFSFNSPANGSNTTANTALSIGYVNGTSVTYGGTTSSLAWSSKSGFEADSVTVSDAYVSSYEISTAYNSLDAVKTMSVRMVPEPATATLSLLALAGLAARRRRH